MSDYVLRAWQPADRPALKELWRIGFGDEDAVIDSFHDTLLQPGGCIVAEADGKVVSAMYILPGQTLRPFRKRVLTAGYTYALATLPEYRGRGIGAAVYKACCDKALETADVACVLPAERELYPFYEKANGASPLSYIREAVIERSALEGVTPAMAARIPGYQYAGVREMHLSGQPHGIPAEDIFDYLEENGMEFFMLENGAAMAETIDGVCYVREFIDPSDDPTPGLAAVARWCRAERYIVASPAFFDGPGAYRPYMLGVMKQAPDYPMPNDLWWGPGLE